MGTLYKHRGCRSLVAACRTAYRSSASQDWLLRTPSGEMRAPIFQSCVMPWCPDCRQMLPSVSHWHVVPFDPSRERRVAELIKASIGILNGVP